MHEAGKPTINVHTYPSDAAAELAVASGRADLTRRPWTTSAGSSSRPVTSSSRSRSTSSPALKAWASAGASGSTRPVTKAVNHLIATGSYKALMSKWGVTRGLLTKAVDYNK